MGTPTFQSINPGLNPSIAAYMAAQRKIDGRSMTALKIERESLLASLEATGQAQPATIVWLNPVAGHLDGGIDLKLRSINDPHAQDIDRMTFKVRGRDYKAVVVPVKKPLIFSIIKDVKQEGDREYGIYEPRACKQIEIAYHFLASYTSGTPNSCGMGGIVVFEGDRRVLERKSNLSIKVPERIMLPNGWCEYKTVEKDFGEELGKSLDLQKAYANIQTQQAQSFWDQEDQRGNITVAHRVWHQHEVDMGWRQNPAPWVTLTHEHTETCVACGEPKKRVDAYFCHKCQRVYDPLAAYMDREIPVTHPGMERIADKDWPSVHKEEARRRAIREAK